MTQKTILITGATGLVATELIENLLRSTGHSMVLVSRSPLALYDRYAEYDGRVKYVDWDTSKWHFGADVCVHAAFARSSDGGELARSLQLTAKIMKFCRDSGVQRFINISSQSVYGNDYPHGMYEVSACKPDYMYALAKYSSEVLGNTAFENCQTEYVVLRLSSVSENARFIKVFVERALSGENIKLTAPYQTTSFIDVRDVASALKATIECKNPCSGVYNLGSGKWYTIETIARNVRDVGCRKYDCIPVEIEIVGDANRNKVGMDISKFCTQFGWEPKYTINDMIISLFELLTNINGGGYPHCFKIVYKL